MEISNRELELEVDVTAREFGVTISNPKDTIDEIKAFISERMDEYPSENEAVSANMRAYFESVQANTDFSFNTPQQQGWSQLGEVKPADPAKAEKIREKWLAYKSQEDRQRMSDTAIIETLLVKYPPMRDYVAEETFFVPTTDPAKLAEYEEQLIRDNPENVAAFEELKDAAINHQQVKVRLSDSCPLAGVRLRYENELGEQVITSMSRVKLLDFVFWEAAGEIGSSPDLGIKASLGILSPSPRNIAKARMRKNVNAKLLTERPVLRLQNVADVLKSGGEKFSRYVEYIYEQHHEEEPTKKSVKSEKFFKIWREQDTFAEDNSIVRKKVARVVRLSGFIPIPPFVAKDEPGFADIAGGKGTNKSQSKYQLENTMSRMPFAIAAELSNTDPIKRSMFLARVEKELTND